MYIYMNDTITKKSIKTGMHKKNKKYIKSKKI